MKILRFFFIFIFIFLNFQLIHTLDFNCPNSYCGITYYSIKYPFKLQDQQPQICSNYINLTCSPHNVTLLNIPFSGDFHVDSIDYFARSIKLHDPKNCLAKRLMNLNLSSSPFTAESYQKYTFYKCPLNKLMYIYDVTKIDCLSVYPNVTVASSEVSSAEMEIYGCSEIATKDIPVAWHVGEYDTFISLRLKWNVQSCQDCEESYPQKDKSKFNTSKLIAIVLLIPLVILAAFLVASYKRVANARAATREAAQPQQTTTTTTTTAVQLASVEDIMVSDGQYSRLKTVTFSAFLEGNSGSLEDHDQGSCCTICLEEFSPQDIIRCLTSCRHYFHSRCIDQWFEDNSSCPVCRISIFNI